MVDKTGIISSVQLTIGGRVFGQIKSTSDNYIKSHSDNGSSAIGVGLTGGDMLLKVYKSVQTASPTVISAMKRPGEAVQNISSNVRKLFRGKENENIRTGAVKAEHTRAKSNQSSHIRTGTVHANYNKPRYVVTNDNGIKTYSPNAKGDLNKAIKHRVSKDKIKKIKQIKSRSVNPVKSVHQTGGTIRLLKKSITKATNVTQGALSLSARTGSVAVGSFGNMLGGSDDMGVQALNTGIRGLQSSASAIKTTSGGIKTASRGIKTATKGSIRTVKGTVSAIRTVNQLGVKGTGKVLGNKISATFHKAGKSVVNMILGGFKFIIAKLAIPVFIVIFIAVFFTVILSAPVLLFKIGFTRNYGMGSFDSGNEFVETYNKGTEYKEISIDDMKERYDSLFGYFHYDPSDMTACDLISLKITLEDRNISFVNGVITTEDSVVDYGTAYASEEHVESLKDIWEHFPFTQNELMAIAYILLQKEANLGRGTVGEVYLVVYNQAVLNQIFETCAEFTKTEVYGATCPPTCTTRPVYYPGPPPGVDHVPHCYGSHTLHQIEVQFSSRDSLMDALEFTEADKQWVEWIIRDFEINPDITPLI